MEFQTKGARRGALVTLGIALVALASANAPACAAQPAAGLEGAAWVRVSYAKLLDDAAIVRTGQPLTAAVRDSAQRGAVQPFIDPYTSLLQHAVEMLRGPDGLPYTNVTDRYEPGAAQPAWVAIFRGGRVHAVADGRGHVRLFLPGRDPAEAYTQHYSIVRHCLNALVPRDGKPMEIEVYEA